MISSMTGFARRIEKTQWGAIQWEARSLNHRGLDVSFRLPDTLISLEPECRRILSARINRGRIDAFLRLDRSETDASTFGLNTNVLKEFLAHAENVRQFTPESSPISVNEVLKWPGILTANEEESTELNQIILDTFEELVSELDNDRVREGERIQTLLVEKVEELKQFQVQLVEMVSDAEAAERDRLKTKLAGLDIEIDADRVAHEIAIALIKSEVNEEVDRFQVHLNELERVLLEENIAGKRLGFLLQELGREVNTISAKSAYVPLSTLLVDVKVTLEQIREQIQNVA